MKSIIIFTSIFLLCGCAINTKSLSSPKSNDDKTILEAEKYKQQYQKKIFRTWDVPSSSSGMSASVKVFLTDTGQIEQIIFLDKEDLKFKSSIEKAIWRSSPFNLPSNPEVRKQARKFNIKFISK
ncbi:MULTISPECIES: TonB C-terminal domain-containing protein [Acinetobacter]|uniref:TonB C-terminal domain-containing protein n=1 Tax=Acinetobacter TaxID=469 RepID=UPI00097F9063|nr:MULTISPECIES: TonB C-terminal domain-containing protein [Acinetobacter]MDQ9035618.1 TonB C-terminal domain-containing protein [Acinetobacter seifertii]MEB3794377.1 TonB C-terminal domain-containing protein [Acinetobacter sp. IK24]MEB3813347.1 TonB C-terminal domain-containing protein [Acinetobacter sp. IK22]MEB3832530.1 TonB C-terminal domain-containing protein [Acinetobacter sp. IK23]MEB3836086.1 TonB C-terminal domain-containing protein [Acinetobacter sp. IK25]